MVEEHWRPWRRRRRINAAGGHSDGCMCPIDRFGRLLRPPVGTKTPQQARGAAVPVDSPRGPQLFARDHTCASPADCRVGLPVMARAEPRVRGECPDRPGGAARRRRRAGPVRQLAWPRCSLICQCGCDMDQALVHAGVLPSCRQLAPVPAVADLPRRAPPARVACCSRPRAPCPIRHTFFTASSFCACVWVSPLIVNLIYSSSQPWRPLCWSC